MESSDLELIKKYGKDNNELDRLYQGHLKMETEIKKLQSIKISSVETDKKLRDLKKVKLEGRDRMEQIFQTLR